MDILDHVTIVKLLKASNAMIAIFPSQSDRMVSRMREAPMPHSAATVPDMV